MVSFDTWPIVNGIWGDEALTVRVCREMAIGNTFGATALSSYGGFWLSFAIVLTPGGFDIVSSIEAEGGAAAFHNSFGFFLMVSRFLLCLTLVSRGRNRWLTVRACSRAGSSSRLFSCWPLSDRPSPSSCCFSLSTWLSYCSVSDTCTPTPRVRPTHPSSRPVVFSVSWLLSSLGITLWPVSWMTRTGTFLNPTLHSSS